MPSTAAPASQRVRPNRTPAAVSFTQRLITFYQKNIYRRWLVRDNFQLNNPDVPHLQALAKRYSLMENGTITGKKLNNPNVKKKTDKENKKRKKNEDEEEQNRKRLLLQRAPIELGFIQKLQNNRLIRHLLWLFILFTYSLIGGLAFSAIEGSHDRTDRLRRYELAMDIYKRRRLYQQQLFRRFRDIDTDRSFDPANSETLKLALIRDVLGWYERKLGVTIRPPIMEDTRWNVWGGVYYAASLYTTIGYGNFYCTTRAGQVLSMVYAFFGIPLVATILLDWGFLYYTVIESLWNRCYALFCNRSLQFELHQRAHREQLRRVGSEMSLRSLSTTPLIRRVDTSASAMTMMTNISTATHRHHRTGAVDYGRPMDDQREEQLVDERVMTVPLKVAFICFICWIALSAFVVRLWETKWTYFTAFYYFFTSLTTIGLGDVVTETPNYIVFNLALTLVGLSVVGLCIAIVQAKVRLVYNRLHRSIDAQYRIRQIDPDIAMMAVVGDAREAIKRLSRTQSLQDRIVYHAMMDEHKKALLESRWRSRINMVNRVTQTWSSRIDKSVQTGMKTDNPIAGEIELDDANDVDTASNIIGSDRRVQSSMSTNMDDRLCRRRIRNIFIAYSIDAI